MICILYRVMRGFLLALLVGIQPLVAGPLPVVATNSILGDLTQQVGGEAIALRVLAGPGTDPHTFEPSPSDARAVRESAVFIENGLGLETWADKLYRASGSKARRVVAAEGVEVIEAACRHGDHDHRHQHDADPHVWTCVGNAKIMVENIRRGLTEAKPERAEFFAANAEGYGKRLEALEAWIRETVATVPENQRKLVTNHDVFQYFARSYGFTVLGDALGSVTTEAGDPSAARLAALVREIQQAGVPAIFADQTSKPHLVQRVAREAGVALGPKLLIDSLGPPGSEGDSYEKMMRFNVAAITEALGGKVQP